MRQQNNRIRGCVFWVDARRNQKQLASQLLFVQIAALPAQASRFLRREKRKKGLQKLWYLVTQPPYQSVEEKLTRFTEVAPGTF